jgi:uncharacterized protein
MAPPVVQTNIVSDFQASFSEKDIFRNLLDTYFYTDEDINQLFTLPLYREIIKSKAFQRLKKIHFLGSIDFTVKSIRGNSSTGHTRYQHSIGVAALALSYSISHNLCDEDQQLCVVSALLHDIGHAPLSHTLESVFDKEFGINHHISGEAIIRGEEKIGEDLSRTLRKHDINPFEILSIISGHGNSPQKELFNYPINIDTIEAITRSMTYINQNVTLPKSSVLKALTPKISNNNIHHFDTKILDNFWMLKNRIYATLIQSNLGIVADLLCKRYMEINLTHFNKSYYYGTEDQLLHDHAPLFKCLKNLFTSDLTIIIPDGFEIQYLKRDFYINNSVELESFHSLKDRYSQKKIKQIKKFMQRSHANESSKYSNSLSLL